MNLIERYIEEVGKHLPNKTRADIQAELRSTLEDMLEDRAQATGQAIDDDLRKTILKEFGAPEKVAASYLPERYLIGPKLFPFFSMVLKIVLSVLTGVTLFGFGIRYGTGAMTTAAFAATLGKTLLEYLGGIISAFGNIVLVFAILQRTLPASEFEDKDQAKDWNPADLEKEPEPDEVRMSEPIWAIIFTVAGLLIFNLYPQVIGIGFFEAGNWTFVPVLSAAFFRYLPWINVLSVLQIALNLFLFRQGRWTIAARWLNIVLSLGGIVLAYLLLSGPSLVAIDAQTMAHVFQDSESAGFLTKFFGLIPPMLLIIVIIVEGIETLQSLYRLLFKRAPAKPGFAG